MAQIKNIDNLRVVADHWIALTQDEDYICFGEPQAKELCEFLQRHYKWIADTAHIYDLSSMD